MDCEAKPICALCRDTQLEIFEDDEDCPFCYKKGKIHVKVKNHPGTLTYKQAFLALLQGKEFNGMQRLSLGENFPQDFDWTKRITQIGRYFKFVNRESEITGELLVSIKKLENVYQTAVDAHQNPCASAEDIYDGNKAQTPVITCLGTEGLGKTTFCRKGVFLIGPKLMTSKESTTMLHYLEPSVVLNIRIDVQSLKISDTGTIDEAEEACAHQLLYQYAKKGIKEDEYSLFRYTVEQNMGSDRRRLTPKRSP